MTKQRLEKALGLCNAIEDKKERIEELENAKKKGEHRFLLGRKWFVIMQDDCDMVYNLLLNKIKAELKDVEAKFKEL
jgi:hypothetical protein